MVYHIKSVIPYTTYDSNDELNLVKIEAHTTKEIKLD